MHGVQTTKQTQHVVENPGSIELNASFKTLFFSVHSFNIHLMLYSPLRMPLFL